MIHYKRIFFASLFLFFATSFLPAFSQLKNEVNIKGSLKNSTYTSATLFQIGKEMNQVAVIPIDKDGNFTYKLELKATDFYRLQFDNSTFVMCIFQAGENVEISSDVKDFMNQLVVKGSEQTEQIFKNQKLITTTKAKLDSISNASYQILASPKYDSLQKVYSAAYDKISKKLTIALSEFVEKNLGSLAILFIQDNLKVDDNIDLYSKADSVLMKRYPENFYVNNFTMQIEASKKTRVGSVAPDFTLADTNGVNVSLSLFKGKYLLVDFWASWCGPCMKEVPNVQKLYADFHSKGFEILGVSLDKDKASWTRAIRTKPLPWTQVSDLKQWKSMVVPLFNISGIPYTLLLDKEGKIIAKGLRGDELYKKVESLMK
jgi:peroxiredoxin